MESIALSAPLSHASRRLLDRSSLDKNNVWSYTIVCVSFESVAKLCKKSRSSASEPMTMTLGLLTCPRWEGSALCCLRSCRRTSSSRKSRAVYIWRWRRSCRRSTRRTLPKSVWAFSCCSPTASPVSSQRWAAVWIEFYLKRSRTACVCVRACRGRSRLSHVLYSHR